MSIIDTSRLRHFVIFLGNPRSGTTLVRSLLNAHPEVCIAVEVNVIARLRDGATWESIVAAIAANEARFARNPTWTDYEYAVESVGPRSGAPLIIGDKKSANTTMTLALDWSPVERLAELCQPATLKVIHCVRHPLDTIATRALRKGTSPGEKTSSYFDLEAGAALQIQRPPLTDAHRIHLETLIGSPEQTLSELLRFLDLDAPPGYVDACRALLYDTPRQTRHEVRWPRETLAEIAHRTRALPHLAAYVSDIEAAARAADARSSRD